jgi:hypothetical protein
MVISREVISYVNGGLCLEEYLDLRQLKQQEVTNII